MLTALPVDILRFLRACDVEGRGAVLVTLAGVSGSSPRGLGSQMAIAEDGRYVGSLSGGCVEAAVVAEALDLLAAGTARCVRFGAGSPYIDIKLPCGSGIDLWFTPRPDPAVIADVLARIEARSTAVLALSPEGNVRSIDPRTDERLHDDFLVRYVPGLRIVVAGQGEDLVATARLAGFFGAETAVLTPDTQAVSALLEEGLEAIRLTAPGLLGPVRSDPWTAIVYLFHDPDWEEALLPRLLLMPGFYHGAVGSARAQQRRRKALRATHVPEALLQRLRGPIGTIANARDPATLALSILAEVVEEYRKLSPQEDRATLTGERANV